MIIIFWEMIIIIVTAVETSNLTLHNVDFHNSYSSLKLSNYTEKSYFYKLLVAQMVKAFPCILEADTRSYMNQQNAVHTLTPNSSRIHF
jgi:hypothetical protein